MTGVFTRQADNGGYSRRKGQIGVVVVTYNSAETVQRCLRSIHANPAVSRIVVIDNHSSDGTAAQVQEVSFDEPRLRFFRNSRNHGFAMACNQGASALAEPWVAFINPDVYLESDTLTRLLAHAIERAGAGLLGVELHDVNGDTDRNSRRQDISLVRLLRDIGDRDSVYVEADGEPVQQVEAVSGALMLMPSNLFVQLGGFDEEFRMHAEDLDMCRRVRDAGYEVLVANDIRALHIGGVSSRSHPLWVEWQKHRSLWRYFRKFEAQQTAAWMRPLLWLGLWAHFVLTVIRNLVSPKY
jgi:GT2 family glycosyltransferase